MTALGRSLMSRLPRQDWIRTNFGREQLWATFLALKKSAVRLNYLALSEIKHQIACPKCHKSGAYRSRRKDGLDLLLAFFLVRPFRCRSCRRRYYRMSFGR